MPDVQRHWYPLYHYHYVRSRGYDHHATQDLAQEFFTRLAEKRWLNAITPPKGRFRTFLLAAMSDLGAVDAELSYLVALPSE